MIIHGLSNISSLFRGDKEIIFVYHGDTLVYQKNKEPVTQRFNSFVSYNTMSRFNSSNGNNKVIKTPPIYNSSKFNSGSKYNSKE